MLRITTIDQAYADIDATLITVDGESLACWREPAAEPVARYRLGQVSTVEALDPPPLPARGRARADAASPNAFRRWTEAEEQTVIQAYHRGDTFDEIAAAVGRRVAGVRARLIGLGVIERAPGDRLVFGQPPFAERLGGTVLRPRLHAVRSAGEGTSADDRWGGPPGAAEGSP